MAKATSEIIEHFPKLALSQEERREKARAQVAHQVKFAKAIGKTPAGLVEELMNLFPISLRID